MLQKLYINALMRNPLKFAFDTNSAVLWRNIFKRKMNNLSQSIDPQQEELLKSPCILVDYDDKNIGSATKEVCHLMGPNGAPPPLHRAFSVFLFNSKNEILLQQRSDFKITFPHHLTNTCCSHPLAIEDEMEEEGHRGVLIAAKRRLHFELGIPETQICVDDFEYLTRIHYASPSEDSDRWGEHEIDYIIVLRKDVTLRVNTNEIKRIDYVGRPQFDSYLKDLETDGIPLTPWFKLITRQFLPSWWTHLSDLSRFVDHRTIHRFA